MQSKIHYATFANMTAKLTITLSDEVLDVLRANKSLTLRLDAPGTGGGRKTGRKTRRGAGGYEQPRAGSLPARVIDWAAKRKTTFGTNDIAKKFKLSRAHASMLLSRLASGPYPIHRESRGVYSHAV